MELRLAHMKIILLVDVILIAGWIFFCNWFMTNQHQFEQDAQSGLESSIRFKANEYIVDEYDSMPDDQKAPNTQNGKRTGFDTRKHFLVFFHIQKTSGTYFDNEMMEHMLIEDDLNWRRACNLPMSSIVYRHENGSLLAPADRQLVRKTNKYRCKRPSGGENWILSPKSIWDSHCAVHADFTDLKWCIGQVFGARSKTPDLFYYFTMLRDPVRRFISEWLHVRKGREWTYPPFTSSQSCANDEWRECRRMWPASLFNITLEQFMNCSSNLAFNRQTRMLALYDKRFSLCSYFKKKNDAWANKELLNRAKLGLDSLHSFGLAEYQDMTRRLFIKQFDNSFQFDNQVIQYNQTQVDRLIQKLDHNIIRNIKRLNSLDMELYEDAQDIFLSQLSRFNL